MIIKATRAMERRLTPILSATKNLLRPQPVAPHAISPRSIEKALDAHYGLNLGNGQLRTIVSGCMNSAVWLCEAEHASLYVKVFKRRKDQMARVRDEVNLYTYLNDRGIRAPETLPAHAGRKVVELKIGRAAFDMIAMRKEELHTLSPSKITEQDVKTIATTLGHMHRLLKTYPYPFKPPRGALVSPSTETLSDAILASPNANEFTHDELDRLNRLETRLTSYLDDNLFVPGLSSTLIHGDLTFENLRLTPNGEVYLMDFADRFHGPVIRDLAVLISNFHVSQTISTGRFDQLQDMFLKHYVAVNPLPSSELRALTPYIAWYAVASSHHHCLLASKAGRPNGSQKIKAHLRLAQHLLETEQAHASYGQALRA